MVKLVDQGDMLVFRLKQKTFFVSVITNLEKWNGEDTFNRNSSTIFLFSWILVSRKPQSTVNRKLNKLLKPTYKMLKKIVSSQTNQFIDCLMHTPN